jgi:fluoride exporter
MPDDTGANVALTVPAEQARTAPRPQLLRQPWDVLAVIAVGGAAGAVGRYGIGLAWPTPPGGFPAATLTINITGCAAIGVLLVLISEVWAAHRLVRPCLGTGVLGGYTTFSTYAVDTERLISGDAARTGLLYLVVTPIAALAAVWLAVVITRRVMKVGNP